MANTSDRLNALETDADAGPIGASHENPAHCRPIPAGGDRAAHAGRSDGAATHDLRERQQGCRQEHGRHSGARSQPSVLTARVISRETTTRDTTTIYDGPSGRVIGQVGTWTTLGDLGTLVPRCAPLRLPTGRGTVGAAWAIRDPRRPSKAFLAQSWGVSVLGRGPGRAPSPNPFRNRPVVVPWRVCGTTARRHKCKKAAFH
jgi:hypothetical protein